MFIIVRPEPIDDWIPWFVGDGTHGAVVGDREYAREFASEEEALAHVPTGPHWIVVPATDYPKIIRECR